MALINCPECGNQISDQAEKCPNCAYPINEKKIIVRNSEGFFLQSMNFGCSFIFYGFIALVIIFILFNIFS
ncbi:MAG: zinc ribbon domain-containing protein [Flavobacterium sp.]|jgi:hypothetical protein|uniref:zinc ribbon domain-containing protein n=1 Tax=Flavobacterium sp. TaxID=239 RepID=UPI0022CA9AF7|nr:zinc ribbon domain-containing protein [Flavobacterium sp.]MCZ8331004.1 zinc ribbon domain-containing protein [Flavobacterium sp.]